MKEKIYAKKNNGNIYYYFQHSFRVKIDPKDKGKTKGSGKSKVITKTTYLGSAASIHKRLIEARKPIEVHHLDFGFVGAIYNVAKEIGLIDILQMHIKGERFGIPNWKYFLLAIINRLHQASSKEKMGAWASKTILPELLNFEATKLNSKSFWYSTDDIINEKDLQERRSVDPSLNGTLCTGINDAIFNEIEKKLIANLEEKYDLFSDVIFYDTTNFFTYFEEPLRSQLARTGHNKASKHHLKQVGLALCVDKKWGIPLYHQIYRGNSHDSKTFTEIISDLINRMKAGDRNIENMILIMDKGNNSKENFRKLKDKMEFIGSLVVSNYPELLELPLEEYHGKYQDFNYFSLERKVFDIDAKLVLTYNDKLARKQKYSLDRGIEKLQRKIEAKWFEYKKEPVKVPKGIKNILSGSRYGKYLDVSCKKKKPIFSLNYDSIAKKETTFGKILLFSSNLDMESSNIIEQYHSKDKVEKGFKLLKDPDLIRWQPIRHWTDTKIRAFAFCCVMSLIVMKVMELKLNKANLKMSHSVLKMELNDLKKIIMVYNKNEAAIEISHQSTVQKKLWDIFKLGTLKK